MLFLRTVILARCISRGDMGIAALFQTTIFLFDMISDLNVGMLLIQSPLGDEPALQSTAQTLNVGRGLINSALLLAVAWPVSVLFKAPGTAWAFAMLALVPALRGLLHLDTNRLQRHHIYKPAVFSELAGQVAATVAIWPLAITLRDYSAMLWVLVIQSAVTGALSHVLAQRKYRWGWCRQYAQEMLHFGWPLLVNGLLMFAVFQGDRVIIGAQSIFPRFTKDDLGVYSIAFSLTLIPSMILARVATSLFLPRLSKIQHTRASFLGQSILVIELVAVFGGAMAIAFAFAGAHLIVKIYGVGYAAAASFVGLLGIMQCVRLIRAGTAMIALARGDSRNSMFANLSRMLGVIAAILVAALGGGLRDIVLAGLAGEVLALVASMAGLLMRHQMRLASFARPFALTATALLSSGAYIVLGPGSTGLREAGMALLALTTYCLVAVAVLPQLRGRLLQSLPATLSAAAPSPTMLGSKRS